MLSTMTLHIKCVDIDECKLKLSNCAENAECINTEGSYECQCKTGFQGNGIICIGIVQ